MRKKTDEIRRWYAVYTKPRWEKKVHALLESMGVESYCPLNKVRKKWSDRYKIVNEPLFKSYLFVRVTEEQRAPVRLVHGVVNFVYWLGKPAVIKNEEIEKIRRFLNEYSDVRVELLESLTPGTRVLIQKGIFMDHLAKVISERNRAVVLEVEGLGCRLVAQVLKTHITPVGKS